MTTTEPSVAPPVGEAQYQSQIAASLRLSEAKLAGILASAMDAIIRDISNKKRLESQFLRAQRMESIGALAGGVAHELNNALSPILTAVELLQMRLADESSQRLLNILHTNAVAPRRWRFSPRIGTT
jgi:nitrogen-specific signal transduction histidine kinase